jgi:ABC-type multidrug transport system fused ATPase/permease subunit
MADGIQGVAELLVYGSARDYLRLIDKQSAELASTQVNMAVIASTQSALVGMLGNTAMWVTLLLSIPLVNSGQLNGVYLGVLALAALTCFEAVLPLPQAAQYLGANLASARRLFEIVDAHPAVETPQAPAAPPENFAIQVDKLTFAYPDLSIAGQPDTTGQIAQPQVLNDVSLALETGKSLAIVGPSGSGKSTLVSLLLRFWDFSSGSINIGGRDVRDFDPEMVRGWIAVVMQNPYIFSATLRDNLLIARPGASFDDLLAATRRAQLYQLIQSLPLGFDTWVGEHGLRLSGGERQRLAIARALLREAPLLILDEPTANLDARVEREILQVIGAGFPGRSTLLITHRLVGLEAVDEILVMQNGRVVERGHHTGLLAQQGIYWRMLQIQNQVLSRTLPGD